MSQSDSDSASANKDVTAISDESDADVTEPPDKRSKVGRKPGDVKQFFMLQGDFWHCQITNAKGSKCGAKYNGAATTSMIYHIDHHHKIQSEALKQQKLANKSTKPKQQKPSAHLQPTIEQILAQKSSFSDDSPRQKTILRSVCLYLAGTSAPYSHVNDPLFRLMLAKCEPRFKMPSEYQAHQVANQILDDIKLKIRGFISTAKFICIAADIWSKKDMQPYIGVTAHMFCRTDNKKRRVTLAVKPFEHPHTAECIRAILDRILIEWDIDGFYDDKVLKVLTDNASNMLKAFRTVPSNTGLNEFLSDVAISRLDPNLEDEADENVAVGDADVAEFDESEMLHENQFGAKRLSCCAHTLQLIVNMFEKFIPIKPVIAAARSLVRSFRQSSKASENLRNRSGYAVVGCCPTRWNSVFLMIERLLKLKDDIVLTCQDQNIDGLQPSQWLQLQDICDFLQPFSHMTDLLSAETTTTFPQVIPAICNLKLHLESAGDKYDQLSELATAMLNDIKVRFARYTTPTSTSFDQTFCVATFLDHRYRVILTEEQTRAATYSLEKLIRDKFQPVEADTQSTSASQQLSTAPGGFAYLTELLKARSTQPLLQNSVKSQINSYQSETFGDSQCDPIEFWIKETKFPLIREIALDILSIPATSASVERIFSTAGIATANRRNRLKNCNLECEVLIRTNLSLVTEDIVNKI